MIDKLIFIVPCYNASQNLETLINSLKEQTDNRWYAVFVDDMSEDDTASKLVTLCESNFDRFSVFVNKEKKFALRNIVEQARKFQDDDSLAIAVLDGDDSLCNKDTVKLVLDEYTNNDADCVWTAHKWDVTGMNISGPLPDVGDVYAMRWKSSHLKTFKASLLRQVCDANFKDLDGSWFTRGYDAALMSPLLHESKRRVYIPEVCYLYNINSCSFPSSRRSWAEREQLKTINTIRARKFIVNE
mgnify:CR=1 FL=1